MDVVSPQLRRFVVLGIRFIVLSVWISLGPYLLYTTLWQRLAINVEGKVISVRDIPYPCAPPGHKSEYTFQSSDGSNSTYIATPGTNAPFLPVDLPVGTYIKKRRWHIQYVRDGQKINDFRIWFVAMWLAIWSLAVVAVGLIVQRAKPSNTFIGPWYNPYFKPNSLCLWTAQRAPESGESGALTEQTPRTSSSISCGDGD